MEFTELVGQAMSEETLERRTMALRERWLHIGEQSIGLTFVAGMSGISFINIWFLISVS